MKFNDVRNIVLKEMSFEVGKRKDGTFGFRSIVNGNMTDVTPKENKIFTDAVIQILKNKGKIEKLSKFDLETIDIESMANGNAKINFEDGTTMNISSIEINNIIKGVK